MILFINACVRHESRTKRLADHVVSEWNEPVTEIRLDELDFEPTNEKYLIRRDRLVAGKKTMIRCLHWRTNLHPQIGL